MARFRARVGGGSLSGGPIFWLFAGMFIAAAYLAFYSIVIVGVAGMWIFRAAVKACRSNAPAAGAVTGAPAAPAEPQDEVPQDARPFN